MTGFPDESRMERSEDGSEPIRGGSIGLNRILNGFVDAASSDSKPRTHAVLISAFTIVRNLWTMANNQTIESLEQGFVNDVNLFLEYLDAYLSHVWGRMPGNKFVPVIIYFPDYHNLPKELDRDNSGKIASLFTLYKTFLKRHGRENGEVKKLDHTRCFWISAGHASYPHKEVASKFRDITGHKDCLYTTGDPVWLITNVPLDLYIASRLRGILLLESYTARLRKPDEFRLKLDKEGRVPFQPAVHVALGDDILIKRLASLKQRKQILEAAVADKWLTRSEEDIRQRIAKIMETSSGALRKYDFI